MRLPAVNPFDFSHPVDDALVFAGRSDLLADVSYYLEQAEASPQPVSLALLGPRAAGKTSFLNVIQTMAEARNYLTVRIDLDESDTVSPLVFFHRLLEETLTVAISRGAFGERGEELSHAVTALSFGEPYPTSSASPLRVAESWAAAVRHDSTHLSVSSEAVLHDLRGIREAVARPIVVLLDEADTLSNHTAVLQKLRNIFQRADGFLLVLAGTDALFPELDRVFSPISRQFKTMVIGAFEDPRETADCVRLPLRKVGLDPERVMDADTYEELHDIARGRPYEVKLLCHFMFRRVQSGGSDLMRLDLDVLEDVRRQLERERDVAARPILTTIRGLDTDALEALAILVGAGGNASVDDVWQAEYAIHGTSRFTQSALTEACGQFVDSGVLSVVGERVLFCGDEFDRLYTTYFALERSVVLAFPPVGTFPLNVYWSVALRLWLRGRNLLTVGPLRSGEGRKQLDDLALLSMMNAMSGVTADMSLIEQNLALALDLYGLTWEMQLLRDEVPVYRVRLQLGPVDISGLFTGPGMLGEQVDLELDTDLNMVRVRIAEMKGSLEVEKLALPIYRFGPIVDNMVSNASTRTKRLLASLHAVLAVSDYADPETRPKAKQDAVLAYRYGADIWPVLANNVGYVLLADARVTDARDLLLRTLQGADGSPIEALIRHNLAVAFAQLGEFDLALNQLDAGLAAATDLDEEDRSTLCLFVGSSVDGRLRFAEEDRPDLVVAMIKTREAIQEASRRTDDGGSPDSER